MFNVAPTGARLAALALVPALAALWSCASAPKLPPKAGPDEVAVYDPNVGQYPPDGYKAIGAIRIERPLGTSHADIILALRTEAAKLGADGIIIESITRSTEGMVDADLSRDPMIIATARAIYYPPAQGTQ